MPNTPDKSHVRTFVLIMLSTFVRVKKKIEHSFDYFQNTCIITKKKRRLICQRATSASVSSTYIIRSYTDEAAHEKRTALAAQLYGR